MWEIRLVELVADNWARSTHSVDLAFCFVGEV
jgi:hypothetical protein